MKELPANRRVTIRDIARNMGVSHVTVSYALRGLPRVSAALRKKICKEAERLGYSPDPMLQALCEYRKTARPKDIKAALGWLACWNPPEAMHALKEFHAYWLGAKATAERHGYRLEEFFPTAQMSLARIQKIMRARGIRGVLIPPPQSTSTANLAGLNWDGFALVKFGHSFRDLKVNLVTSAHVHNTLLAFAKMTERGYRRIGFATSAYFLERTLFAAGFLRAQYNVPAADRVPLHALSEAEIVGSDTASLEEWITRERPDAILTNLHVVPGMLRSLGLRIPDDMPVAVLSVHDGNADAGIDQNPFEIGKAACEMLVSQIIHGGLGVQEHLREVLIEGSWVDGSMLPDRRRGASGRKSKNKDTPPTRRRTKRQAGARR